MPVGPFLITGSVPRSTSSQPKYTFIVQHFQFMPGGKNLLRAVFHACKYFEDLWSLLFVEEAWNEIFVSRYSFNWETKEDNFKVPSGTLSNFAPPIKHVCFDLTNFLFTSGTNIIAKVKLSYKTRSKHHHQGPKRLANGQMFLCNIHVCFSP